PLINTTTASARGEARIAGNTMSQSCLVGERCLKFVAAEATVRLARRAGPDAVRFLRHIVSAERVVSIPSQGRAACAVLEVARLLGPSAEARSTEALRGQAGADGRAEAGETS